MITCLVDVLARRSTVTEKSSPSQSVADHMSNHAAAAAAVCIFTDRSHALVKTIYTLSWPVIFSRTSDRKHPLVRAVTVSTVTLPRPAVLEVTRVDRDVLSARYESPTGRCFEGWDPRGPYDISNVY